MYKADFLKDIAHRNALMSVIGKTVKTWNRASVSFHPTPSSSSSSHEPLYSILTHLYSVFWNLSSILQGKGSWSRRGYGTDWTTDSVASSSAFQDPGSGIGWTIDPIFSVSSFSFHVPTHIQLVLDTSFVYYRQVITLLANSSPCT